MTAPEPRPSVPPTTCEKCGFVLMASDTLAGPYCVNPKCSRRGAVILPPLDIRVRVIPSAAISIPAAASEEQDVSFKSHSPDVSFKSLSEEPPATSTPPEKCLRCNGAGFVGGNPYPCPRCNGIGFEYSAPPSASPEPPPTISQLSASRELIPAEEPPPPSTPELTGWMAMPLEHTRTCQHWNSDGCTCALEIRILARDWMELHNAWRKRAEEAEAELNRLRVAPPASPEPPELRKLLKDYGRTIRQRTKQRRLIFNAEEIAARAAIVALYARQREEIRELRDSDSLRTSRNKFLQRIANLNGEVASLRSQLEIEERQSSHFSQMLQERGEQVASLASQLDRQQEEIDKWEASALTNLANYRATDEYAADLSSQLERLKAEQMEVIGKVIEQFRPAHPKRCTCGDCQW